MSSLDFSWEVPPTLHVLREKNDSSGNLSSSLDNHGPVSAISVMKEALSDNVVSFHLIFSSDKVFVFFVFEGGGGTTIVDVPFSSGTENSDVFLIFSRLNTMVPKFLCPSILTSLNGRIKLEK